jgi:hypothetical protein
MFGKPSKRQRKRLAEQGTHAPATVVSIAERGMAVTSGAEGIVSNTELLLKTTLRVEPDGQPSFEVTKRISWPQLSVPSAGMTLNVVFNPDDHDDLMVDRDAPIVPAMHLRSGDAMPDLDKLLGAVKQARDESGGDRAKFAQEIRENLAEQGITAAKFDAGDGSLVLGGLGGLGAPQSPEDAKLARLEQLGKLKQSGVLTEEEFQAEKAKILGGS